MSSLEVTALRDVTGRLREELESARGDASCVRERSTRLQHRIDELTLQLEEERSSRLRATLDFDASAANPPPTAVPITSPPAAAAASSECPSVSDAALGDFKAPTPSARSPPSVFLASPPPRVQLVSAAERPPPSAAQLQAASWAQFVRAAARFSLSERDLFLVSAETLRQLVAHCGEGNPVETARIELHWQQHNAEASMPPPPPPSTTIIKGSPKRRSVRRSAAADAADTPSSPSVRRAPAVSAAAKAAAADAGASPAGEFCLRGGKRTPSLGNRRSLSHRGLSAANPNGMLRGAAAFAPQGRDMSHRRSLSPAGSPGQLSALRMPVGTKVRTGYTGSVVSSVRLEERAPPASAAAGDKGKLGRVPGPVVAPVESNPNELV